MIRHYRVPCAPLRDFVGVLWLYDDYVLPHAKERLLPTATTELVFDLRGSAAARGGALVAGPHSQYSVLETSVETSVIGVHFLPGGAFPFLGLPAAELHNTDVTLELLWGPRASSLREQILAASTPEAKFDVLERGLLERASTLARHGAVVFALRELARSEAPRTVSEVTDAIGLSHRRFIDRFRNEVGMTPKLFARVQRFQTVIRRVHTARSVDWAEIAAGCGYFDQAHFIHDFREFAGFTPQTYFALKSEQQNHVPLPD